MTGLLIPYYEHPSARPAEWDAIIAAAPRLYGVVLNPASGPGDAPDPAFAEVAARLRAVDVRVLGYADTDYGRRPHADVVRDIARHRDWYRADGVFLDQVAADRAEFGHYQRLATAAWGAGCGTLALNHGTAPHPSYARIADLLVTFEGPGRRTPGSARSRGGAPPECGCATWCTASRRASTWRSRRAPAGPPCTVRCRAWAIIRGARCRTGWRPLGDGGVSPGTARRAPSSPPSPRARRRRHR